MCMVLQRTGLPADEHVAQLQKCETQSTPGKVPTGCHYRSGGAHTGEQ